MARSMVTGEISPTGGWSRAFAAGGGGKGQGIRGAVGEEKSDDGGSGAGEISPAGATRHLSHPPIPFSLGSIISGDEGGDV